MSTDARADAEHERPERTAPARKSVTRRGALRRAAALSVAVGGFGTATGVVSANQPYDGWFTDDASGGAEDTYTGITTDMRGEESISIEVGSDGNGGPFAYDPVAVRIDPGTEVHFEWTSDMHNLALESGPDGGWEGYDPIEDTGFSYSHTFEVDGVYKYYCSPHLALGMKAAIVVGDEDVGEDPDAVPGDGVDDTAEGEGFIGRLYDGRMSTFALLATLVFGAVSVTLVLFGDLLNSLDRRRERDRAAIEETGGEIVESPFEQPVREIDHDSFDPRGTLALVLVYLLILVVMWVFTYFIEFLGRGPTVIG